MLIDSSISSIVSHNSACSFLLLLSNLSSTEIIKWDIDPSKTSQNSNRSNVVHEARSIACKRIHNSSYWNLNRETSCCNSCCSQMNGLRPQVIAQHIIQQTCNKENRSRCFTSFLNTNTPKLCHYASTEPLYSNNLVKENICSRTDDRSVHLLKLSECSENIKTTRWLNLHYA